MKKITVIHTTPATIASLGAVIARILPGVYVSHCLDDSVLRQINEEGYISAGARYRFHQLVHLAAASKPDAVLCACSSVGGMLEEAREFVSVPLVRIDEPMAKAAAQRSGSIAVCATVKSTLEPTLELIRRYAGEDRRIDAVLISEAGKYLNSDKRKYLEIIGGRLTDAAAKYDTVVLAQASMAEALDHLPVELKTVFLTSPESGVSQMRGILGM